MESLPNDRFREDMQTGPTACLSFLGLGVWGDFGISGVSPTCIVGFI